MTKRKDVLSESKVIKKKSKKDPACSAVLKELQAFEEASDETRSQTFTRGIDKVLQESEHIEDIREILLKGSNVVGLLVHLATVYFNVKADEAAAFPGLFNENYYNHVMNRLAGRTGSPDPHSDPFLEQYLIDTPYQKSYN
jgi:hypothetical protein